MSGGSGEVRLEQTGERSWRVVDGEGRELATLTGVVPTILGPAAASLVADHGFARGHWVPDQSGGGFRYVPTDPAEGA